MGKKNKDKSRKVVPPPHSKSHGRKGVSASVGKKNGAALSVNVSGDPRTRHDNDFTLAALLDSTANDESIDWEARAKSRTDLKRVVFPKGWEVPLPAVFRKDFMKVNFSKEIQQGTIKAFSGKPDD